MKVRIPLSKCEHFHCPFLSVNNEFAVVTFNALKILKMLNFVENLNNFRHSGDGIVSIHSD